MVVDVLQFITIGDCSKAEARTYFDEVLMKQVPQGLRRTLEFERLYEAFGGRLVHWQDYIDDFGMHYPYLSIVSAV